jgi:Mitochondrial biogenesis AIM24
LHRLYVRQRPPCCHHIVIARPQSLFFGEEHSSVVTTTRQQIWNLRLSSSVATSATGRHPIQSSDSPNNLPQSSSNDENSNNLPVKYIDFTAASKIEGEESHIATITLHPGETLRAESGSMIFMTEGVVCKYFCLIVI